jgi:hypothetical protein
MTMRDQIAAIVADTYDSEDVSSMHCALVADAILAALPDMIAPLVWEDRCQEKMPLSANFVEDAEGSVAQYCVSEKFDGAIFWHIKGVRQSTKFAVTREAAKAAANAHHRAAIAKAAGWTAPPVDSDKGAGK